MMNILQGLEQLYPDIEWQGPKYGTDPLQALVATMLSAQCRDDYVDRITPSLFAKYKTPQDYVDVSLEELREDIKSINHYRKKAERIQNACKIIIQKYNGQVPLNFEALTAMSGIGPKTANAVMRKMGVECGMVIDTHCKRTAYRLGISTTEDANKARLELEKIIPKGQWGKAGWRLILHGRNVCHARNPECGVCGLAPHCKKVGL